MTEAATVDDYLAALPEESRCALQELRRMIASAAPNAIEVMSYKMPAFQANGRFLLSYAAYERHCSLYPATEAVQAELGDEIRPYLSGKGTIRFTVDEPLPPELVKRIVEIRLRETEAA